MDLDAHSHCLHSNAYTLAALHRRPFNAVFSPARLAVNDAIFLDVRSQSMDENSFWTPGATILFCRRQYSNSMLSCRLAAATPPAQ
jgi:hypothetical protein